MRFIKLAVERRLGLPHLGQGLVVVYSEHNSETLVPLETGNSLNYALPVATP